MLILQVRWWSLGPSLFACCDYPLEDSVAGGSQVVGDMHYGSLGIERFCKACRSLRLFPNLASAALLRIVPKDRTPIRVGQKMGRYQKNTKEWRRMKELVYNRQ